MTEINKYKIFLDKIFEQAQAILVSNRIECYIKENLSEVNLKNITILIDNSETQKSIIAVIITSLLKKIVNPKQDVRLHRSEFPNGYSGRSLDTNVVTPWLKQHFTRISPKESGWLTRSIEQPHPFTKNFPGKIRNKEVKEAFLTILEDVENKNVAPKRYLTAIILMLLSKTKAEEKLLKKVKIERQSDSITIHVVIEMLKEHFASPSASRLPVIAIYTIYQLLTKNIKLYQEKTLMPLKGHTVSDRHMGYGDIEIYSKDKTPFEIVEVKHEIPIDKTMINDILKKIENSEVKRYFILTTAFPNFTEGVDEIFTLVREIKTDFLVDIVPNGIVPSLKYYLRFVPDLRVFLKKYTENLKEDFRYFSDVKKSHLTEWLKIKEKYLKFR